MFPPKMLMIDAEEEDEKGVTPPPLLMVTELGHTVRDWIVTYHFFLGPLDGHFAMRIGPLKDISKEAAVAAAADQSSSLLGQARLALLQAVILETMH